MLIAAVFIAWLLYWRVPDSIRWWWLIGLSSLVFLWLSPVSFGYVMVLLLLTWGCLKWQRLVLGGLIAQLIIVKVWFTAAIIGLSFLTFFLIHYVVDFHRQKISQPTFTQLARRALFFPLLTAGPIERFQHFMEHQSRSPLWTRAGWLIGLGVIQKWVLADWALVRFLNGWDGAQLAEQGMSLSPMMLWSVLLGLFGQLYCDFAGYSNLAIGVSALFGFRVAENFRMPLLATNPADFWKRWHISLSGWCQEYVYMPMLGITRNPYLGILSTFVVMGLWHALSWHWLCWGLAHALVLMLHLRWKRYVKGMTVVKTRAWSGVSWLCLMLFWRPLGCLRSLTASHQYRLHGCCWLEHWDCHDVGWTVGSRWCGDRTR